MTAVRGSNYMYYIDHENFYAGLDQVNMKSVLLELVYVPNYAVYTQTEH